jgi:hypothetical protein
LQERLQRYQQEMLGYGFKQVTSAKRMMRLALGRDALLRLRSLTVCLRFSAAKHLERLS